MGTGYNTAYKSEANVSAFKQEVDEKGTPFIEIDKAVCDYIRDDTDDCVRKMFDRHVKVEEGIAGIFPFKVLSHSFAIGGIPGMEFDPDAERESNDNMRKMLHRFKEGLLRYVDPENDRAMQKVQHYIAALNQQLEVCDATDEIISALCRPFPRR